MKKIIELIEKNKAEALYSAIFNQKLPGSTSDGTYTQVLSFEEETMLVRKVLNTNDYEADPWLEILQQYSRIYPLSNQAVQELLDNMDNPKAIPLLLSILSAFGYNEAQGIALCKYVLQHLQSTHTLKILQLVYERAHFLSPEIHRLLENIDCRMQEVGYIEQAKFTESYCQAIENYRKIDKVNTGI